MTLNKLRSVDVCSSSFVGLKFTVTDMAATEWEGQTASHSGTTNDVVNVTCNRLKQRPLERTKYNGRRGSRVR